LDDQVLLAAHSTSVNRVRQVSTIFKSNRPIIIRNLLKTEHEVIRKTGQTLVKIQKMLIVANHKKEKLFLLECQMIDGCTLAMDLTLST